MKLKTVAFLIFMALLAWLFTAMFLWTLEINRNANNSSTVAADAPPSPYQRVLGLDRLQWESMGLSDQDDWLRQRRESLESLPPDHPDRERTLPELYYWMATVATRQGKGAAALDYLDRAGIISGSEDWYYLLRGAALEASKEREEALDAYLTSFAHRLLPVVWGKLQQFGLSPEEVINRTLEKLADRSRPFPPFHLASPDGIPRSLQDFAGRVVLVNFFFPG